MLESLNGMGGAAEEGDNDFMKFNFSLKQPLYGQLNMESFINERDVEN